MKICSPPIAISSLLTGNEKKSKIAYTTDILNLVCGSLCRFYLTSAQDEGAAQTSILQMRKMEAGGSL